MTTDPLILKHAVKAVLFSLKNESQAFQTYLNYCTVCGKSFIAPWNYKTSGCSSEYWEGNYYRCPSCFTSPGKNHILMADPTGEAPVEFAFSIRETANLVIFRVTGKYVQAQPQTVSAYRLRFEEKFIYDIPNQTTRYVKKCWPSVCSKADPKVYTCDKVENPYANEIWKLSFLRYLTRETNATGIRSEISSLLKRLRTLVAKKLKAEKGYDMKSTYTGNGQGNSYFLQTLHNLAWRMAMPDGPNLPIKFGAAEGDLAGSLDVYAKIYTAGSAVWLQYYLGEALKYAQKGLSYPQAMLKGFVLPDTKAYRKLLAGRNLFTVGLLKNVAEIQPELSYQIPLCKLFIDYAETYIKAYRVSAVNTYWAPNTQPSIASNDKALYEALIKSFGGGSVYKLLDMVGVTDKNQSLQELQARIKLISDSSRLYRLLPLPFRIDALKAAKLSTLHDTLVEYFHKVENADFNLNVPEAIINRLSLQQDKINFFCPQTRYQLAAAGKELHNCVGSYARRVADGRCYIVLVANDKGKLKVCLEIIGTRLVQAKLVNNKPVMTDPKMNAKVCEWAQAAGLEVATADVVTIRGEPIEAVAV